jgi:hypothetical protein
MKGGWTYSELSAGPVSPAVRWFGQSRILFMRRPRNLHREPPDWLVLRSRVISCSIHRTNQGFWTCVHRINTALSLLTNQVLGLIQRRSRLPDYQKSCECLPFPTVQAYSHDPMSVAAFSGRPDVSRIPAGRRVRAARKVLGRRGAEGDRSRCVLARTEEPSVPYIYISAWMMGAANAPPRPAREDRCVAFWHGLNFPRESIDR